MNKLVAQTLAKKENGEKGFTLIELLVVVIIIGILAAIAIPVFLNMRQGAWRSAIESDASSAALAIESLATANNGAIPTGLDGATLPEGPHYFLADGTAATAATAVGTITVSPDNSIAVTVAADGTYTLVVTNATNLPDDTYTYTSATGAGAWS